MDRALERGFGKREGAGVVVDVKSGSILAARDLPLAAHRLVLPGSTVKAFVLYILLETGKLRPVESFICPYHLTISGLHLDCPHAEKMGQLTPAAALAWSCNNFFATMATRLSPLELARGLARWGFASPTRLAGDEGIGDIATVYTEPELELEALGEFGIHTTPLELLQAYRRLALRRSDPAVHDASLDVVFDGLEAGVRYGMARAASTERLSVAGKTGTSRVEGGAGTHGWFAGFAPADAPEIALVIYVERGNGPVDAAGIAHTVFAAWRDSRPRR
ncbi:MAG TPA: penicillin-binding transpeptidase domain-containing protein [Candidatus Acidoferrales bacterium]|nr:penicillin-binding transpeptidase domain-containing protein [Candidatus Acidoferrales bacterium]